MWKMCKRRSEPKEKQKSHGTKSFPDKWFASNAPDRKIWIRYDKRIYLSHSLPPPLILSASITSIGCSVCYCKAPGIVNTIESRMKRRTLMSPTTIVIYNSMRRNIMIRQLCRISVDRIEYVNELWTAICVFHLQGEIAQNSLQND